MSQPPMSQPPLPPMGWYPNPDGTPTLRWWDGARWGDAVQGPPPAPGWYGPTGTTAPASRGPVGRTGIVISIVLLVLAAALGVTSIVFIARSAADEFVRSPTMPVPGTQRFELSSGDYYIYDPGGPEALAPADVTVLGPDGYVRPQPPSSAETVTRNGVPYVAAVGFHVAQTGRFTITVGTSSGLPHLVVVAPTVQSFVASIAGWIAGFVLALLIGVTGVVLLIVFLVRASRARRARALRPYS
jgi:Protein of unknown function (DUF2510)